MIDLRPRTGRGVRVAVVDSGVIDGHPHVGRLADGFGVDIVDARGQEGPGSDEAGELGDAGEAVVSADAGDVHGHGTACAAVVRWGAPEASIIAVRVLDRELGASARAVRVALERLTELEVDVVNLSLGIPDPEIAAGLHRVADRLLEKDVVLISAVRLDGAPSWPSTHPGVIAVGADPALSGWQYRRARSGAGFAFAACPYPRPIPGQHPERNFAGTSFAAPRIAALAARAREADRTLARDRLLEVLTASAPHFDHTRRRSPS